MLSFQSLFQDLLFSKKRLYEPDKICCLLLNTCCQLNRTYSSMSMSSWQLSCYSYHTLAPDLTAYWFPLWNVSLWSIILEIFWRDCGTYRGMNMLGPWLSSKSSTATVSKTQWLGMLLPCFCVTQLLYSSKNNYPLPQSFYSQYLSTFALPLQAKLKIVSFSVSTQISKVLFQLFISNWGEKQTLF